MSFEYDQVVGVSEEEFRERVRSVDELRNDPEYRAASSAETEEVERMLDVLQGTLANVEFLMKIDHCDKCGNELGVKDFVQTSLADAKHSKSAVLHTLVGNKFVIGRAKSIRCSKCSSMIARAPVYAMSGYACGETKA